MPERSCWGQGHRPEGYWHSPPALVGKPQVPGWYLGPGFFLLARRSRLVEIFTLHVTRTFADP